MRLLGGGDWRGVAFTSQETKNSLLSRRRKYKDIILSSWRGPCVEVMTRVIAVPGMQVYTHENNYLNTRKDVPRRIKRSI